jgi:hypothetical protein
MRKSLSLAVAVAIGTTALSHVSQSNAGPIPTAMAAVKTAVPEDVIEVRNRGGAIFAGLALGLIGAAIAGNGYYGGYYPAYPYYSYPYPYSYSYSPYPYYGYPSYGYPYYRRYRYGYRRYW